MKCVHPRSVFPLILVAAWSVTGTACNSGVGATSCAPSEEFCNGEDDDCDGEVDEDSSDAGGECDTGEPGECGAGRTVCNDGNIACEALAEPSAEVCDGADNDCNGEVDDGDPGGGASCSTGLEGICGKGTLHCVEAAVSCAPDAEPGDQTEGCNELDDDCDGLVDEDLSEAAFFLDADLDGYGSDTIYVIACSAPAGYVPLSGDCRDDDKDISPGATEICDEIDNNCNALIDEGLEQTFYQDLDADNYGSVAAVEACNAPTGYVAQTGDCNDYNDAINPGESESCNEIDDDCNGKIDDGLMLITSYLEYDGDGFAAANAATQDKCDVPAGWVEAKDVDNDNSPDWDCNDSNATAYPGAPELCDNLLNNCLASTKDIQCPSLCTGSWPTTLDGVSSGYIVAVQLDDDPQLEIVAQGNGTIRVWEHDGTLKWEHFYSVAYSYPTVAEMDGDRYPEVVLFSDGAVYVFDGQDGTLEESYAVPSTGYRRGILADLDGDQIIDLVAPATGGSHTSPGSGSLSVVLRNGMYDEGNDDGIKQLIQLSPPNDAYFAANHPAIWDIDGDGLAEVVSFTGYSTCTYTTSCKGYMLVYDLGTGALKYPASQFVVASPNTAYASGLTYFADYDSDGEIELLLKVGGVGNGLRIWNMDGTVATATNPAYSAPALAPIKKDGTLELNGSLHDSGARVDIGGDGHYARMGMTGQGLTLYAQDDTTPLDGYPVGPSGGRVLLADINADTRLDVLYLASGQGVSCYTLGQGSYAPNRVVTSGHEEPFASGMNRVGGYDSYEPNDVRNFNFDPSVYTAMSPGDPRTAVHAFQARGMLVQKLSGSGWSRRLTSAISIKGDRDYYTVNGRNYISAKLESKISPPPIDLQLRIHAFDSLGGGMYEYEGTLTGNAGQQLNCPSSGGCFNGEPDMFVLEVRGKDENVDYGPWPYQLDFSGGAP